MIKLIEKALSEGLFSACAVGIFSQDSHREHYFGYHSQDQAISVREHSVFDLASLTKVLFTASFLGRCFEKKILNYETKLKFSGSNLEYCLQDLMTHQAGFKAWDDLKKLSKGDEKKLSQTIRDLKPVYSPKQTTVYSDLGFITMMQLLENHFGQTWDSITNDFLGSEPSFSGLFFAQKDYGLKKSIKNFVATQNYAHRPNLGYVNDENCYFMGGTSSHAGLFGTLKACIKAGQAWLNAVKGDPAWIGRETALQMIQKVEAKDGSGRAMCWDKPSDFGHGSTAGDYISNDGFGHLGYTGTSIWVDPQRDEGVIVLANRVHPQDRHVDEFRQFRKDIHNALWGNI